MASINARWASGKPDDDVRKVGVITRLFDYSSDQVGDTSMWRRRGPRLLAAGCCSDVVGRGCWLLGVSEA